MTTIFLDTNIYLHCTQVQDVPWPELLHTSTVQLIVPYITVKELDEQKDTNRQRHLRDRAERALHYIETWTASPTDIRKNVSVKYYPTTPIDFGKHRLNLERADDYLIATILQYQKEHPDDSIVLFTQDTGARLTAREVKISAMPMPDEYVLPPATDAVEEENKQLRAQLRKFESAHPRLALTFTDASDHTTIAIQPHEPITDDIIVQEMAAIRSRHPSLRQPVTLRQLGIAQAIDPVALGIEPPPSEYDRHSTELATYYNKYEEYLRRRDQRQAIDKRTVPLLLRIGNGGGAPGTDIDISVTFTADGRLFSFDPRERHGAPPAPPDPPRAASAVVLATMRELTVDRGVLLPSLDFPKKNLSDPEITSEEGHHAITWHLSHLKHTMHRDLRTLYFAFEKYERARSFQIQWTIHAGNYPTSFSGTLHFVTNLT